MDDICASCRDRPGARTSRRWSSSPRPRGSRWSCW